MVNVHIAKEIELIKMKNNYQLIVSIIISLTIIGLLSSCGTRKTDTQQLENIVIENKYDTGSKIVLGNTFTYKPFDALKPMVIEGKKYENAIVSNDKSTIIEKWKNKTEYITRTITVHRTTEKTDHTILYIGLAFVICLFLFLWFYLSKFKTGI